MSDPWKNAREQIKSAEEAGHQWYTVYGEDASPLLADADALLAGVQPVKAFIADIREAYPEGLEELGTIQSFVEPIEAWLAALPEHLHLAVAQDKAGEDKP